MTKNASRIASFPPVAAQGARILILGSMPGEASLKAGQYYAHPRNAFWPIMGELCACDATAPYQQRVEALQSNGIAIWDVLKSCRRAGSLDSAIESGTTAVNDFETFFDSHPRITSVLFNGAAAERCYRQQVLFKVEYLPLAYTRLPSTSPAHASLSIARKAKLWHAAMKSLLDH